ncbi:hypothetical protein ABPG74_020342 [Tetrahymena malaccensis]
MKQNELEYRKQRKQDDVFKLTTSLRLHTTSNQSHEDNNYNNYQALFHSTEDTQSQHLSTFRQYKELHTIKEDLEVLQSQKTQRDNQFIEHYKKLQSLSPPKAFLEITQSPRKIYQKGLPQAASFIDQSKGFLPKYFYSYETSLSVGNEILDDGEIVWEELKFINVLLTLMQEFTTSNFFVLPFAFYQGGFLWSNIFLFLSFIMTAYPMVMLVDLKRLTNLTLRELCYAQWGSFGKKIADICVFFIHFSDLYSYIQALSIMIDKFSIFFDLQLSDNTQFWIQIILFYPLVCNPKLTSKLTLRYVCDAFMALGFFLTIYLNLSLIRTQDFRSYSFLRSVNIIQSAMNMFSSFEESISVYEIYRDKFTASQTVTFKKYIWLGHFCIYLMSLILCNLTWLAFGDQTKPNVMEQYDDDSIISFVGKVFFIFAAVPAYGHLFQPLDLMSKDLYGIYSENNRLAYQKLKYFDKNNVSYYPKHTEVTGISWFKLCYFHTIPVQEEMEQLNKDLVSVKYNKRILFYLTKFFIVYFSVSFGMLTSDISNAIFNILQIFFKTPISLIIPCHLYLILGNLSYLEKIICYLIIVIGYILTFTSFVFFYQL